MDSLDIFPLSAFDDNYIWVLRRGAAVAVVDPGDDAPVLDYLAASGTYLAAVLVTHHHADHVGGITGLVTSHPAPVYGPSLETIVGVDHGLADGDRCVLADLGIEFDVLTLPGHTRGHLAYYRRGTLFCGDTLFGAGCGRLFEGTPADMQSSLARIRALPEDTRIYCAHEYTQANLRFAAAVEPDNAAIAERSVVTQQLRAQGQSTVPSVLADEVKTNPFLRWDAPAVIAAAARRIDREPNGPIEAFAAIREWRNRF